MTDITQSPTTAPAGIVRRTIATILDAITIVWVAGLGIGKLTGGLTDNGFSLSGMPALVFFAVIIAYFYVGRRHLGGTFWDRVFCIPRPHRS